ncbi:hypothetical protein [Oceanobacillus saliphilus]|uniref:hypothetical protein n=1 Tax=Oceanobacillus saliphilus TaxID=2925834 RepID=UPI00201E18D7|nr:hypothetical protein [Oceanobacillus saliphilus]
MDEFRREKNTNAQVPPHQHGDRATHQDYIGIEPDSARDEEYAQEMTADDYEPRKRERDNGEVTTMYGWIAIAVSVISFFMWPIVLGAAGIILGFVSRSRGADMLGNIAIAAGAISILISLFIFPFV